MADCQYLIEDRPRTIFQFLNQPLVEKTGPNSHTWREKKVFGLWKNHNRNLTDIEGVYLAPTWLGIEYYMKKKGVL